MLQVIGYLLLVIGAIAAVSIGFSLVRWQLRKAAATLRHRKLIAQGYVVVTMPISGGRLLQGFTLDLTESHYVHESVIAPFTAARARGLEECNRLMAEAWNRFAANEISSEIYIQRCQLYAASYARIGDHLDRQATASGLEPHVAQAVQRQYYHYDFPDPRLEMLKLRAMGRIAACYEDIGGRTNRRSERQEGPMKDVTPRRPEIGSRRIH